MRPRVLPSPHIPHTRALFVFDRGRLVYDDPRQFGRIEVSAALPETTI